MRGIPCAGARIAPLWVPPLPFETLGCKCFGPVVGLRTYCMLSSFPNQTAKTGRDASLASVVGVAGVGRLAMLNCTIVRCCSVRRSSSDNGGNVGREAQKPVLQGNTVRNTVKNGARLNVACIGAESLFVRAAIGVSTVKNATQANNLNQ